jgi:hypothetical protein
MSAVIFSVLLGVLLLSASALKSAQPPELTARAAVALGLPKTLAAGWHARCAVALLVGLEVSLAIGLQVPIAVRVAAAGAFLFFITTGMLLARAAWRGAPVPCGCFGDAGAPRPVGLASVLRNAVAATMSLLLATGGVVPLDMSAAASWAVGMAMTAGSFTVAFFILARRGRAGSAPARLAGEPEPGMRQSADWSWQLPMSDGTAVQGELLKQVGRLLIVFSDPSCAPCRAVQAALASYSWPRPDGTGLVIISRGAPEANLRMADDLRLPAVALQQDFEIATRFNVGGTPGGVVVEHGVIVSGPATGTAAMSRLVAEVAGAAVSTRGELAAPLRILKIAAVERREHVNEA